MAKMNKFFGLIGLLVFGLVLVSSQNTFAQTEASDDDGFERIELGLSAGVTQPLAGTAFKDNARSSGAQLFWLGYSLDSNWAIEAGYEKLKFDGIDTDHQVIALGGAYRLETNKIFHPVFKAGLGTMESKNAADDKTTAFSAKLAAGIESDFKYLSVGALLNYYFITKAGEVSELKNVHVAVPSIFLTFHNSLDSNTKSTAVAAPAVSSSTVIEAVRKDTDGDGVLDEDDKCSNTPAGVVVNQIGCSEKEKAEMKLNIEFALGKADIDPKYTQEVSALADFMKKFPETKIEIAGHSDNVGSVAGNTRLSQKRAEAVKKSLVDLGVDESRLTAKGYGPSKPIADNKTVEGRAQNRRVMAEITVVTDKKK